MVQWEPGFEPGRTTARRREAPVNTPSPNAGVFSGGSSGIETLEDSSPAIAMARQIEGDQTGVKVVGSCAH